MLKTSYMKIAALLILLGVTFCGAQQFEMPDFHSHLLRDHHPLNQPLASDTSGFTLLGVWKWGRSTAVAVRDTLLYMANGSLLQVYSIADTAVPVLLGEIDLMYYEGIGAIVLKDSIAYVAAGNLVAVNVNNPRAPHLVAEVDLFATPTRIAVVDSFLYVVTFSGTFWVVDISDPSTLVRRGWCLTAGERASAIAARKGGRFAYGGTVELPPILSIFDARNPDAPVRRDYPQWTAVGAALVADTLLFIGGADGLSQGAAVIVYSIAQDSFPRRLAHANTRLRTIPVFALHDTMLYLAEGDSVKAISVANPSSPSMLLAVRNTRPNIFGANEISASHEYVFAAQGRGVWALSSARQDFLRERWFFPTGSSANAVALKGNLAFVSSFLAGLWILDIANLDSIVPVANVTPGGGTVDVVVTDRFACTVQSDWGGRGVTIFNVADPLNPTLVSHYIGIDDYPCCGPAVPKLAYANNILTVTKPGILNQDTILAELVDISDPLNPVQVGIIYGARYEFVKSLLVRDTLLLLATNNGFRIFSIADPSRPAPLSTLPGSYSGVEVQRSYLYTTSTSGFHVIDISIPSNPQVIGSLGIGGSPALIYSNGFVFGGGSTLYGIDVRNPYSPQLSQTYGPLPGFSDIVSRGDTLFLSVSYGGVRVLKHWVLTAIQDDQPAGVPREVYLSSNYPNPFNSQTSIEFGLPTDQSVVIKLYDVLGREVKELLRGKVERGHHVITMHSESLSSGVYFYQLLTESGQRVTKPMILIK